jgi:hypothetical protein
MTAVMEAFLTSLETTARGFGVRVGFRKNPVRNPTAGSFSNAIADAIAEYGPKIDLILTISPDMK